MVTYFAFFNASHVLESDVGGGSLGGRISFPNVENVTHSAWATATAAAHTTRHATPAIMKAKE